jgi:hypothetical protein
MQARLKRFLKGRSNSSLNPLEHLIVDRRYPWGMLYTSLLQKTKDVFKFFAGDTTQLFRLGYKRPDRTNHRGLLHLLVFPLITEEILGYLTRRYYVTGGNRPSKTAVVLRLYILAFLEVPHNLLAGLCTLAVSPLILGVHVFTHVTKKKIEDKIKMTAVVKLCNNTTVLLGDVKNFSTLKFHSLVCTADTANILLHDRNPSTADFALNVTLKNKAAIEAMLQMNAFNLLFDMTDVIDKNRVKSDALTTEVNWQLNRFHKRAMALLQKINFC